MRLALLTLISATALFSQLPATGLKYRLVGPFRGGRVRAVTGIAGDPTTFYFGATSGGVWKTTDAGATWKPLTVLRGEGQSPPALRYCRP